MLHTRSVRPGNMYPAAITRYDPGPVNDEAARPAQGAPEIADPEFSNEAGRLVALSFSSERPALRQYDFGTGWEVLGHEPGEADLSRLNTGAAPLLKDHRGHLDAQIGVVVSAEIVGGRGRAIVQIADTAEGEAVLSRIQSGEIRNVSVGYAVRAAVQTGEHDGYPVIRATAWEAVEISLVATPADPTVGVGRSMGRVARPSFPKGISMTLNQNGGGELAERNRAAEIASMGRQFSVDPAAVSDAIARGTSVADFGQGVLDGMRNSDMTATRSRHSSPFLKGEAKPYSLTRAVAAAVDGNWSQAGFEREMAQEMHRISGRSAAGFYVPTSALVTHEGRALLTTQNAGSMIGTDHMGGRFIDALKPQVRFMELGATVLSGLVENVSIPRMTAGTSAEWIAEDEAATESTHTFDAVALTLKQLSANLRISRHQMKQSLPAIDQILTQDLRTQIALALDRAAIAGAGTANQPLGLLNMPGVTSRAMGADVPSNLWKVITSVLAAVEAANVDPTALGWLTNYKVKGLMMARTRFPLTETMILSPDEAEPTLAGHRILFSGNVPDNLTDDTRTDLSAMIFGNWSDLLIGQWGGVDIIVDDATEATKGNIRIAAHSEWDIATS